MHENSFSAIVKRYEKRFAYQKSQIKEKVPSDMKISLVIPCYDEPAICNTLDSLLACHPPQFPVEVLIMINSGLHDTEMIKTRNRRSLLEIEEWKTANAKPWLSIHALNMENLPPKHAGVGLARKIGMDEALYRFAAINYCGMIVCLDADCVVKENYLLSLEHVQMTHAPQTCTVHFEHDIAQEKDPILQEGIIYYELFLRYYVNALAYTAYPFAMHTIGSSMAVRADTYALSGGMNRRKAGEDFYFLHKVVPLGDFFHIQDTTVYPSSRLSNRVPFGTGKAQQDWLNDRENRSHTYHPDTFEDLKHMLKCIPHFYEATHIEGLEQFSLPESVGQFFSEQRFIEKLKEMKAHSTNYQTFGKRFFSWFDGFKALKFVHYCRDYYYKPMELCNASQILAKKLNLHYSTDALELLEVYRKLDKSRNSINLTLT